MTYDLKADGFAVGRRRVTRLMRQNGLQARQKRRFKRMTDSHHAWPIAPNLLDRDFTAERPNQKWAADISYIWTAEGWLYLAVVMDLFSRRIVGWATSDRLKRGLALEALRRAVALRCPPPGLIHHADRGSQYCSMEYRAALDAISAKVSMSGQGNGDDNAGVEAFFRTIKSELIWRTAFQTRQQAYTETVHDIGGFYNPVRRHSACGYESPIRYEMMKERNCALHFYEASPDIFKKDGSPIAQDGLRRISPLYDLEREIRGRSADERLACRQQKAKPVLDDFHVWLHAQRERVSRKSRLGIALTYIAQHWSGLTVFAEDGRIEIDNNLIENRIRPQALTRKNALFAGHDEGGASWAKTASLIETCRLHSRRRIIRP